MHLDYMHLEVAAHLASASDLLCGKHEHRIGCHFILQARQCEDEPDGLSSAAARATCDRISASCSGALDVLAE